MQSRAGLWVVVVGVMVAILAVALHFALETLYALEHDGWSQPADAFGYLPQRIAVVALAIAAIGALVAAKPASGWARRWFLIAGVLGALALPLIVIGEAPIALAIATKLAPFAFALGALANRASRSLAWTFLVVVVVEQGLHVWFARTGLQILYVLPVWSMALWLFLALDLLGGFPTIERIPTAVIARSRARSAVMVTSVLLCLTGTVLLALFGAVLDEFHGDLEYVRFLGTALLVAGGLALYRARRRLGVPVGIAIVLCVFAVHAVAVDTFVPSIAGAEFKKYTLHQVTTALPAGEASEHLYGDVGLIRIDAKYPGLGSVQLEWYGSREDPTAQWLAIERRELDREHGRVERVVVNRAGKVLVYDVWKCHDDIWYLLSAERHLLERDLHALFDRVHDATRCDGSGQLDDFWPVFAPAGYVTRTDSDAALWELDNGPSTYRLWWLSDRDLVTTLVASPSVIIAQTEKELKLETIKRIDRSSERPMFEAIGDGKRVLITAFDCDPLKLDVVALHIGPASEPRAPIIAELEGVRCR